MNEIIRSMLFIPGNNPGMIQSADVFDADAIIIDLEDSVAIDEKDSARNLLHEALTTLNYRDVKVVVRINPFGTAYYEADIEVVKDLPVDAILLPKASVESMQDLDRRLNEYGCKMQIFALIETALGVMEVKDILTASDRCMGLMLGGEDLCVDLGCERTKAGMEIFYARSQVLMAAKATQKLVIDTPFTDTLDMEGLKKDCEFVKGLGFDGKASINPRQIETIHEVFSPSKREITYAKRVLQAQQEALAQGLGVFSLDGKMVDLPIIKRAERTVQIAAKIGLLEDEGSLWN